MGQILDSGVQQTLAIKTLNYTVQNSDAGRLDSLVSRLLDFSRARSRGLLAHGGVTYNGEACANAGTLVQGGDSIRIQYEPKRRYREPAAERIPHGFTVVYVDEHLVVVNKAAGLLSVPTSRQERNTLIERLSLHLAKGRATSKQVHVVHRLDRETSGLLVFGRTAAIAADLIAQFAAHKPEREYAAIVAGRLQTDHDEIRSYLITDKALNQKSLPRNPETRREEARKEIKGELAITHYQVQNRYRDATTVTVTLETGRRNQIRVHFAEMGHPVLGDQRYQRQRAAHPAWPYPRLALHAHRLGFTHPVSLKALSFTAPLPLEFAASQKRFSAPSLIQRPGHR